MKVMEKTLFFLSKFCKCGWKWLDQLAKYYHMEGQYQTEATMVERYNFPWMPDMTFHSSFVNFVNIFQYIFKYKFCTNLSDGQRTHTILWCHYLAVFFSLNYQGHSEAWLLSPESSPEVLAAPCHSWTVNEKQNAKQPLYYTPVGRQSKNNLVN